MRRIFASLLALYLIFACGCSGNAKKSTMYVVDGAYNQSPEEYIAFVNRTMKAQKDSDYLVIPDWDETTENSIWVTASFDISFKTNDAGKINHISFHWKNTTKSAETAVFLVGLTINMLTISDKQGNEVAEQLDMLNFQKKSYETTCDVNGNRFYYLSADYGNHNWFSVDVIK